MSGGDLRPVNEVAEKVRAMEIRGAAKIGREASKAIAGYARSWRGGDKEMFLQDLKDVASILAATRPSAVSLRNSILLTLGNSHEGEDVNRVRDLVIGGSESFVSSSERALSRISEIGKGRIPKDSIVMTHCNSTAALSVIGSAYEDGRVQRVIATESRPWRQGHITARWLAERGIPVTMIVDSAARHIMREVDVVIVGADTITANGAVINKIGTSQLSLIAHEYRIPFLVCGETFKFSRETLLGSLVEIEERGAEEVADPLAPEDFPGVDFRNPVFDATPSEYIDAIITEKGVISPYHATEIIRDMFEQYPSGGGSGFQWLP